MLPRIPKAADFQGFAAAGRRLAELHIGYEQATPYPLTECLAEGSGVTPGDLFQVRRMRFAGDARRKDTSAIVYNEWLTLAGIPVEAHEYQLGSRSAFGWLIDRYPIKTDKTSGITNDPND